MRLRHARVLTAGLAVAGCLAAGPAGVEAEITDQETSFYDVAVDAEGRILVAGTSRTPPYQDSGVPFVARYLGDGTVDPSFGESGITAPARGPLAVLADGRIIAGERRLLADGTIDRTYGIDGVAEGPPPRQGSSADFNVSGQQAVDANGRVVVPGTHGYASQERFAVARMTANGMLDTSFGDNGVAAVDVAPAEERASAVAVRPDGRILIAGVVRTAFAATQLNDDGSPDLGFGGDGAAVYPTTNPNPPVPPAVDYGTVAPYVIAVRPDGTALLAGTSAAVYLGHTTYETTCTGSVLAAVTPSGSLDPSFGTGGVMTSAPYCFADLGLLPSGGAVIAARAGRPDPFAWQSRYVAEGTLDEDFVLPRRARRIANLPTASGGLAVLEDGGVVTAGTTSVKRCSRECGSGREVAVLARQLPDGDLDPSFGDRGIVTFPQLKICDQPLRPCPPRQIFRKMVAHGLPPKARVSDSGAQVRARCRLRISERCHLRLVMKQRTGGPAIARGRRIGVDAGRTRLTTLPLTPTAARGLKRDGRAVIEARVDTAHQRPVVASARISVVGQ